MLARLSGWLTLAALLGGCAAGAAVDAPAPATGGAVEGKHPAFTVQEDQALVTLYRPFNLAGAGQTYHFAINGVRIPGLDVGTRHTAPVSPGPVSIRGAWWPVAPKLDFTAEEGAAYFIVVTPALLDGGPQISHAEPRAAAEAAANLRPAL